MIKSNDIPEEWPGVLECAEVVVCVVDGEEVVVLGVDVADAEGDLRLRHHVQLLQKVVEVVEGLGGLFSDIERLHGKSGHA